MATRRSEVRINVYDLLPPGHLSSFLWHIGNGLLHSGVVVDGKEYAYGGHERRGVTGVYWMTPGLEPPGGTFRCSILHGYSLLSKNEIDDVVTEASHLFLGPAWNLLLNNCNHFTSYLCERLIGQPAPRWLNRAATIGMAMPCMVPREWISPPEGDNEDGELVNEDEDEEDYNEDAAMLAHGSRATMNKHDNGSGTDASDDSGTSARAQKQAGRTKDRTERVVKTTSRSSKDRDASGWPIPKGERAPLPTDSEVG